VDVTQQYGPTTEMKAYAAPRDEFEYLAVFNGGEWEAIAWTFTRASGVIHFPNLGPGLVYLICRFDGKHLTPFFQPHLVEIDRLTPFWGGSNSAPTSLQIEAVGPGGPALAHGETYVLYSWDSEALKPWKKVNEAVSDRTVVSFDKLKTLVLYRLVRKTGSDKLERPFTIEDGKPHWW
jgi:hypothetical protein